MGLRRLKCIQMIALGVIMASAIATRADAQSGKTLAPIADTWVMASQPETVNGSRLDLYVRSSGDQNRQRLCYLRFPLGGLAAGEISQPELRLTTQNDIGWIERQVLVYGLPSMVGNTPPEWSESSLSFGATGAELTKPGLTQSPLVAERLKFLGYLIPLPVNPGEVEVRFSSSELEQFLRECAAGGHDATIILANANGTNREVGFHSREAHVPAHRPSIVLGAKANSNQTAAAPPVASGGAKIEWAPFNHFKVKASVEQKGSALLYLRSPAVPLCKDFETGYLLDPGFSSASRRNEGFFLDASSAEGRTILGKMNLNVMRVPALVVAYGNGKPAALLEIDSSTEHRAILEFLQAHAPSGN